MQTPTPPNKRHYPWIALFVSILGFCALFVALSFTSCGSSNAIAALDPTEHLPGGETTNRLLMGSNAFIRPARNLSEKHETMFYSGNSWFNQSWVEAPASATTRDGLGPLYNATSCSSCHFKDGRGKALEPGEPGVSGLLFRISIPGDLPSGAPMPAPVYGNQLQDFGVSGVRGEGKMHVVWEEIPGQYDDGTPSSRATPSLNRYGYAS